MRPSPRVGVALLVVATTGAVTTTRADSVTLDTGVVYQGAVDKDGAMVTVFDGLKRVVIRDTKIAKIETGALAKYELFRIDQPLVVHAGAMPTYAIAVQAGDWDPQGRRGFEYVGPGSRKPVRMTQAIIELGPTVSQYRGVDGFWRGLTATSEVPREVVLGLLGKVDAKDQGERLKVGRFLIQAQWYTEAIAELDRIEKDFPELKETVAAVRTSVHELGAARRLSEIDQRRAAQQPSQVRSLLRRFGADGVGETIREEVRQALAMQEAQDAADRSLAREVRKAAEGISNSAREDFRGPVLEMLRDLTEAPDAVRDRFEAFLHPPEGDASTAEARFARALSGWIGGADLVTSDLAAAGVLRDARLALQKYLSSSDAAERSSLLGEIKGLQLPAQGDQPARGFDPAMLAAIARHAPPPLRSSAEEAHGTIRRLRARDDSNPEPTDYAVILPPEYHPQRNYPTLVALHGGDGPEKAAGWWAEEAAKRGFLVVAPEYNVRGQPRDYRYSESEHAAVEIALRDARRRFAIDPDRTYLAGVLLGGYMAWDFGLAHPDLFAGVAIISGIPGKYVWAYKDNAKLVPLYVAMGELAPTETDLLFPFATGLAARNYDVVCVEYYKRGLEAFPEERGAVLDWMAPRRREPYSKEFTVTAGRSSDNRFFGVVVKEFSPDRVKLPEQVDPLGKNLKPATITRRDRSLANLLDLETSGLERVDLWLGPPHLNPSERLEIRINGKTAFRGRVTVDLEPFLEDLRIRGDRKQVYWLRYSATVGRSRR